MMAAMNQQFEIMTLEQLLNGYCSTDYFPDIQITGLTLDSRKVESGFMFVALEGQFDHGLAHAEAAVDRGAVVILCDENFDQYCHQLMSKLITKVICVPVRDLQRKLGGIASRFYKLDKGNIFLTGVTGTDGKTSVSHFIAQAMNDKQQAAVLGTLGNGLLGGLSESSHTTPDVISLHQILMECQQKGAASISMEVSSHGLDQERIAGVELDVAVFTNLSRDHLDYHVTLEAYKQAKKKLFLPEISKSLVLNADDKLSQEILLEKNDDRPVWMYSLNKDNVKNAKHYVYADNIKEHKQGIEFVLNSSVGEGKVKLSLIGAFNVSNALACFCVLMQAGINFNHAVKRLEKLHTIAGRMELVSLPGKPAVVIDYAHTPEALSQALINVRKHVNGKLICVFGCGGDRDAGKRPLMAAAAEKLSDLVILTNDNPRNESADNIIDDLKKGISSDINVIVEQDRAKAIAYAINMAGEDDVVLIAGKGHEEFQLVENTKVPFSDKQQAMKYLEGRE